MWSLVRNQKVYESLREHESNDGPFYTQVSVQRHGLHTQEATTMWIVFVATWEIKPRILLCLGK